MDKEHVIGLLQNYKMSSARILFLDEEIQYAQFCIDQMKRTTLQDSIHATANLTGMPRGTNISKPVENLGIMLADGEQPVHIRTEIERLRQLQQEQRKLLRNIRAVDAWLSPLHEREKFVLEQTMIEGHTWNQVEAAFEQRFCVFVSREGLRKLRQRALALVYRTSGCE